MTDAVLVERDGHFATVTLNRPERLNALDRDGWARLAAVMSEVSGADDVRAVIVRGAGGTFGAGADIAKFETERFDAASAAEYGVVEMAGVLGIAHCPHPTIAQIQGACVGGGLEIALSCDIRICGTGSRFGIPINRLGLTLSYAEVELFRRALSRSAAMELLLEGRVVDAARALELGVVNRVVPDAEVAGEAEATARRIADGAPLVNRWHKKFFRRVEDAAPLSPEELAEGFAAFATEDFRIGYRAFLEKRSPEFEGR